MPTLMISLDKEILDPHSLVARRMIEYGKSHAIDIIIPSPKKSEINLSETVRVLGTGGFKWQQFFYILKLAKNLQHNNNYEFITTQDPFLTALAGILCRKKEQLEIQVHGDFFGSDYYRNSGFKNWCYYWLARILTIQCADRVRVVGERVRHSLVKLGVDARKIIVRPVPIDKTFIEALPNKNIKEEFFGFGKYFLYAGRLELEKNVDWLITTFAGYLEETKNNDVLVIVGSGSRKFFLTDLVSDLKKEKNIVFKNHIVTAIDYIKTTDCVLLSSLSEGYGLVAMEAAAVGTKLIMTDVGVANYELSPSDKVTIVPVNDRRAFIVAMKNS